VLGERVGAIRTEPHETADIPNAVRWILGAPLMAFDKLLGAIVLESDAQTTAFDEDHLRLVMAIAGVVASALEQARHIEWLEGENRSLRAELHGEHNMVGDSAVMREMFRRIVRVAATDSTVLLRGESGTGKELAALAIHRNSGRADRPFVAINCAAIVETLLESELFGHERGAFTGAVALKKGKLEAAEGGTVFLDEIGELSLALQAKLLRVLQEREFRPVGATTTVKADFRLICATNVDPDRAVADGRLRQDLYFRLNTIALRVPPLRERRGDIRLLAERFRIRFAAEYGRLETGGGFTEPALSRLDDHPWPGNVRELEHVIERAVILAAGARIDIADLPGVAPSTSPRPATDVSLPAGCSLAQVERLAILHTLELTDWNKRQAAKILGIHRPTLYNKLRKYRLWRSEDRFRRDATESLG
jgi:transcriptional regulator with GAF, ATPase, and Fis domain